MLTQFFGWCLLINSAILLFMTIALVACKGFVSRTHSKLLGVTEDSLIQTYVHFLGLFKVAIIILNLTPYIALKIMA